jgi:hypothetical protein
MCYRPHCMCVFKPLVGMCRGSRHEGDGGFKSRHCFAKTALSNGAEKV